MNRIILKILLAALYSSMIFMSGMLIQYKFKIIDKNAKELRKNERN